MREKSKIVYGLNVKMHEWIMEFIVAGSEMENYKSIKILTQNTLFTCFSLHLNDWSECDEKRTGKYTKRSKYEQHKNKVKSNCKCNDCCAELKQ